MTTRPRQTDCRYEPTYPDHECVVFCINAPNLTVHCPSERCPQTYPHRIDDCGEFTKEDSTR